MHRSLSTFIIMTVAVLVVIGGAVGISFAAHTTVQQRTPINGQTVPLLKHAQFVNAAASQQQLDLSIGLKLRNMQELDTLLTLPGINARGFFLHPGGLPLFLAVKQ